MGLVSYLLNSQVSVDAGVAGGAGQVLVLPVWNVLVGPVITKLLGQPEVDSID